MLYMCLSFLKEMEKIIRVRSSFVLKDCMKALSSIVSTSPTIR